MSKRLPLVQALGWIVVSTFLITGSSYSGLKTYLKYKRKQTVDPAYQISAIVQTGPQREPLKTVYLAELLGISCDRPQPLARLDCKQAELKLLTSPVIKEALVRQEPPNTLYIDYTVRKPVAWLYDFSNTAVDQEGVPFPVFPFFTPKKLPEIYLGLPPSEITHWHQPVKGKQMELALNLLNLLAEPTYRELFHLRRIDVAQAYADSYGKREIVLIVEDEISKQEKGREVVFILPRILRLSTKNYAQELGNYIKLREELLAQEAKGLTMPQGGQDVTKLTPKVIDFRIPHLAFIKPSK